MAIDSNSATSTVEVGTKAKHVSVHQSDKDTSKHQPLTRSEKVLHSNGAQLQLDDDTSSNRAALKDDAAIAHVFASNHKKASQDGSMPYFSDNAAWNGYRNNWFGDVGYAFVPKKDFLVVALGRHIHNVSGLSETRPVTLWSVQDAGMPLGVANVGPHSSKEGHYRFAPLDEPGVTVYAGREYRISQACEPGMADKWYDRTETSDVIQAYAATGYASFVGGVNESGWGYPSNSNGQYRRPGMVNFKIKDLPLNLVTGAVDNGLVQNAAHRSAEFCMALLALSLLPFLQ